MAMTIGKVAAQAGVGVETVRFYERRALIERPPKPAAGGYRDYPPATIERIRFIRQAQALGFSLEEVRELLAINASKSADCADVRRLAEQKLIEIGDKMRRLAALEGALTRLVETCPGRGPLDHCSIIEALSAH